MVYSNYSKVRLDKMKQKEEEIQLFVIKRNGKKVEFDESKIALAIKKGFDSVNEQDEETGKYKYDAKDIDKVHNEVIKQIKKMYTEKVKIEEKTIALVPGQTIEKKTVVEKFEEPTEEVIENPDGTLDLIFKQTKVTTLTENIPVESEKNRVE